MGVLEAVFAVIGLVLLVSLVVALWLSPEAPVALTPIEDRAAPYRDGLRVAARLQAVAQDLEQQIWTEAARHQAPGSAHPGYEWDDK